MSIKDAIPAYNTVVLPYHLAQSAAASALNRRPARDLKVIAVTGTNGKTTTCFMIWKMLSEAGFRTGLITTVAWGGVDGTVKQQIAHMTTPDSFTLNKRIRALKEQGAEFLVLEVTSHALAQHRTLGIPVDIAVMTNVTKEHLDYHKTFARYRDAKCRLFKLAKFGIVNADDPSMRYFISALGRSSKREKGRAYVSYGIDNPADYRARKVKLASSGVKYACGDMKIALQLPGRFNVYNSLAAVAVGEKLGLSPDEITRGLASLESVEGRMNRVRVSDRQNFEVIVDFAHTPDAFQKVFESVAPAFGKTSGENPKKTSGPRIISLFGGAGRRDQSTRAERGEIAGRYSDVVILTEDDTRDENLDNIIAEFKKGAKQAGLKPGKLSDEERKTGRFKGHFGEILTEPDRAQAIRLAVQMAGPEDLILVLGKGHEKTILRADGPHPFEDLKVTVAALEERFGS